MRVTVLSGAGPYADPWHDFPVTSAGVAKALEPLGLTVVVHVLEPRTVVEEVPGSDLVVVNAGGGDPAAPVQPDDDWTGAFAALRDHRAAGKPLLALHTAANTLHGLEEWPDWIGGRWVRGRSMHPPIGEALVRVSDAGHPITEELAPFTLLDERYCFLDRDAAAHVLLHHDHEGERQPLVWATEQDGARTVYDALGHDARSYASPARADLLRREVRWLLDLGPTTSS